MYGLWLWPIFTSVLARPLRQPSVGASSSRAFRWASTLDTVPHPGLPGRDRWILASAKCQRYFLGNPRSKWRSLVSRIPEVKWKFLAGKITELKWWNVNCPI